jgi:beta-lactamase class A
MWYNRRMYQKRRNTSLGCCFLQFISVVLLITALGCILVYYVNKKPDIISPLSESHAPSVSLLEFVMHPKDPDELEHLIKTKIGSSWNNYSVYVTNYNSKFTMGINESVMFTAASVNKVPILAALYVEAQKGTVDFNTIITLQAADIQDYGTGTIRYDPPGTTYSVKTLARLMMQKSDNTAAFLLANYVVGMDVVQKYVDSWGMKQTDMVNNQTSNTDMAILFEKIVNKKLVNPALSLDMLALLKDSDFEDRLPAELPKDVTIYHKIGTTAGSVHDVGVVVSGDTTYYIGIFTSDVSDEEQAAKLEGDLSKIVYDFLN